MNVQQFLRGMMAFLFLIILILSLVVVFSSSSSKEVENDSEKTSPPQAAGMARAARQASGGGDGQRKEGFILTADSLGNLASSDVPVTTINQNCPPGTIVMWIDEKAPSGWVLCNGQAYDGSQSQYANLFNVIQTRYGGSGTNFNVPDLKGRFPLGFGQGTGLTNRTFDLITQKGGAETHSLTAAEMPSHNHIAANFENRRVMWDNAKPIGIRPNSGNPKVNVYDPMIDRDNSNAINSLKSVLTVTGGNQPHNNMPPFLVVNFIIKL